MSRQAKSNGLSAKKWRAHVEADHVPYRKDCKVCLQAASRDRPHLKQDAPSMYSLSSDICGPFFAGMDIGGAKKYFVVFTIRLPGIGISMVCRFRQGTSTRVGSLRGSTLLCHWMGESMRWRCRGQSAVLLPPSLPRCRALPPGALLAMALLGGRRWNCPAWMSCFFLSL